MKTKRKANTRPFEPPRNNSLFVRLLLASSFPAHILRPLDHLLLLFFLVAFSRSVSPWRKFFRETLAPRYNVTSTRMPIPQCFDRGEVPIEEFRGLEALAYEIYYAAKAQ